MKEDNVRCGQWTLARVVATHLGQDGTAWEVTVRTLKVAYKWAVVKIYQLENDATKVSQDGKNVGWNL